MYLLLSLNSIQRIIMHKQRGFWIFSIGFFTCTFIPSFLVPSHARGPFFFFNINMQLIFLFFFLIPFYSIILFIVHYFSLKRMTNKTPTAAQPKFKFCTGLFIWAYTKIFPFAPFFSPFVPSCHFDNYYGLYLV